MKEFEQNWPLTSDISAHQRQFNMASKEIGQFLELPADRRMDVALANHMQGGPSSFTAVRGEATTGKTAWHNMVFGENRRVAVQPQDSEASLFGHGQFKTPTQGKIRATNEDPNFYLNEVSQIDNPAALGVIGDGDVITTVNGPLPLDKASIGSTDNLYKPGQKRVNKRDSAMDSRWRTTVLLGGAGMDAAERIHTTVAERANRTSTAGEKPNGLIPTNAAKEYIQEAIVETMPVDVKEVGLYMPRLLDGVLRDPFITTSSLQKEAARVTEGSITAARSLKFAEGSAATAETIGRSRLSQVASLTVSGVVSLGQEAREEFSEALGEIDLVDAFTAEVILRRLVSAHAQKLAWDLDTTANLTEDKLRMHMKKYSFASTGDTDTDGMIDDYIIKSMYDRGKSTQQGIGNGTKRRIFRRRSS